MSSVLNAVNEDYFHKCEMYRELNNDDITFATKVHCRLPGNRIYTYKHQVILFVPDVLHKLPTTYAKQDLDSLHCVFFTAAAAVFCFFSRLVLALT